jgi:hypothetical protein
MQLGMSAWAMAKRGFKTTCVVLSANFMGIYGFKPKTLDFSS